MEKGKLHVFMSKQKKLITEVIYENGKKQPAPPGINIIDASWNEKPVEVERVNGQIKSIICEGKVIFPIRGEEFRQPQPNPQMGGRQGRANQTRNTSPQIRHNYVKHNNGPLVNDGAVRVSVGLVMDHLDYVSDRNKAKAPYNFIPLNKEVVEAEEKIEKIDFDRYHQDRYTGWIEVKIETKTPLYIRDSLDPKEMKIQEEMERNNEKFVNPNFFSPGGRLRIPGSSLRGMVRNMVEIVSYGQFRFFDDKRLYQRGMADRATSLRDAYASNMITRVGSAYTIKPVAGYLKKKGNRFVIVPAIRKDNTTYYKVEERLLIGKSFYREIMAEADTFPDRHGRIKYHPNKHYRFLTQRVIFKKQIPTAHRHTDVQLYYGKVTAIDLEENVNQIQDWQKGALVCTGWMPSQRNGKHMHWVINEEDRNASPLPIDDLLLKSYRDDINREDQADLLKQLNSQPEGVPCFYITGNQGQVISFGHTGMFRLAYKMTIGEHIPYFLKDPSITDLVEAIFGNETRFAGRVFFEDAFLDQGQTDVFMGECVPRILSTPKPTTFQHYLVQTEDNNQNLNHYNSNVSIRGHKLYWHRSGQKNGEYGWEENNQEQIQEYSKQYTRINPVKSGKYFTGRIRFENLSKIELGALLFSLDLPECLCHRKRLCHKIGMGKPLGLGSVLISPTLHLSNRNERYKDLFFELEDGIPGSNKISTFKSAFEQYVLEKIGGDVQGSLWNVERLKELMVMLDFDKGCKLEENEQIRYMKIEGSNENEFKNRRILPKPSAA